MLKDSVVVVTSSCLPAILFDTAVFCLKAYVSRLKRHVLQRKCYVLYLKRCMSCLKLYVTCKKASISWVTNIRLLSTHNKSFKNGFQRFNVVSR